MGDLMVNENIWNRSIGAISVYGKDENGDLVSLKLDENGKLIVILDSSSTSTVGIDQSTANANEVVVKTLAAPATLPLPMGAATESTLAAMTATTPAMDSITIAAANTEYNKALPANCKALSFRVVAADKLTAGADIRYAFETGKVNSLTLPFHILDGGAVYSKESLNLSGKTIYVAGGADAVGHIVLLEWWS